MPRANSRDAPWARSRIGSIPIKLVLNDLRWVYKPPYESLVRVYGAFWVHFVGKIENDIDFHFLYQ